MEESGTDQRGRQMGRRESSSREGAAGGEPRLVGQELAKGRPSGKEACHYPGIRFRQPALLRLRIQREKKRELFEGVVPSLLHIPESGHPGQILSSGFAGFDELQPQDGRRTIYRTAIRASTAISITIIMVGRFISNY